MSLRPVTPIGIIAQALSGAAGAGQVDRARALATGLEGYCADCTTQEADALAWLAQQSSKTDWSGNPHGLEAEMLSGHVEGEFLRMLVRMQQPSTVLEIGLFTGYSALAMALALPDSVVIEACELDEQAAAIAKAGFERAGITHRLQVHAGPALDSLQALADAGKRYAFVFIDAAKHEYAAYLDVLLTSGLVGPGSFIAIDNTLLQGEPYLDAPRSASGQAIHDFNAALAADTRLRQVLIPIRDGVTLAEVVHV